MYDITALAKELVARENAVHSTAAYVEWMDMGFTPALHHRFILSKLEAVERGEIKRLMICCPPGSGKSMYSSVIFPSWYLGRHPDRHVIGASHTEDLAETFGRRIRNMVSTPEWQTLFPAAVLSTDSQAAGRWNFAAGGGFYATGVGGSVTGRRADCVREGTMVKTRQGYVAIEDIQIGDEVASYDSGPTYSRVSAVMRRRAKGYWRIRTGLGYVVEATGNHGIFVEGNWKPAETVGAGEILLCHLWEDGQKSIVRVGEKNKKEQTLYSCLRIKLFGEKKQQKSWVCRISNMQWMRKENHWQEQDLFRKLQDKDIKTQGGKEQNCFRKIVHGVREGIQTTKQFLRIKNMFKIVRNEIALICNGIQWEPKLAWWNQSIQIPKWKWAFIQGGEEVGFVSGNESLCSLQKYGKTTRTSRGWRFYKQQVGKCCDFMLKMPHGFTCGRKEETFNDSISLVEYVYEPCNVYDIQVEDTHCFFANGILVHNCAIIDDPVRSREDADSQKIRDRMWEWYRADLMTRLKPNAAIILILTRWHSDDLAGRILKDQMEGGESWEVISMPMLAGPEDPLGRKEGEMLWPEWFTQDMVDQAKRVERNWAALYQQSPVMDGGNILKKTWWKSWSKEIPTRSDIIHLFLSWDTAYTEKDSKSNSYSACTGWAIFWNTKTQRHEILCVFSEAWQIDYPTLRAKAKELNLKWMPDAHLVEKKASGQSLVQDLRRIRAGARRIKVRTYNPDRDKIARAYSVQPLLQAGMVHIPRRQWAEFLMDQVAAFPAGAPPSSDFTDTVTQALLYLQNRWFVEHPDDFREEEDDSKHFSRPSAYG